MSSNTDGLLKVEDVAALLNVKVSWVYEMVSAKKIPYIKLGRFVRFRREDLDAYLAERRVA